ncbi:hypothetical protein D3OALGA1CA_1144 [Olavius algarvensis associated proteobacterium Delta 3]|nr:hypothetical protein D3OALGA1CA_1144 [Olavius algarvensis associated proteobacterium Delta 3]
MLIFTGPGYLAHCAGAFPKGPRGQGFKGSSETQKNKITKLRQKSTPSFSNYLRER